MNAAGDRLVVGAHQNDGSGSNAGHARAYSYNGSAWTQLGADIDGEAASDNFGYAVSINDAGSRIAIGALYNDGNGSDAGHVRIYDYSPDTDSWSQVQSDIDGEVQRIEAAMVFPYLHLVTGSRSVLISTMEQRTMLATYVSSI